MKNPELLAVLVDEIKEEKQRLKGKLISLQEEQAKLAAEQEKITNDIREIECQIASITKDTIAKYQILWEGIPYICPNCFFFHNQQIPMQPVSSKDTTDRFKCKVCNKLFASTYHH